jgi:hypothetical protein
MWCWRMRKLPACYYSRNPIIIYCNNSNQSDQIKKNALKNSVFCDITPCSPLKSTDVSEEHVGSVFNVEE